MSVMICRRTKGIRTLRYRRNGSSLLVVLALLAITLALSYGMVRSQVSSVQIQANHNRKADAREAALTGIAVGLRRLHDSDWGGIDETPSGQLDDHLTYAVTYSTGDESLDSSDPDYALYPYRVTVTSTGSATDPSDANVVSTRRVQVVAQLVPRQLSPALADWSEVSPYTLYQWNTTSGSRAEIELPARIEGRVRFRSRVELCVDDPEDASARARLLGDLQARSEEGSEDERPFNGAIDLPFDLTDLATRNLLALQLDLTLNDVAADNNFQPAHPGSYSEYQLYPGGQVYQMETVPFWLVDQTLEPNPVSNPLGMFRRTGGTYLRDNVTIHGSLIVSGWSLADVSIDGSNVSWSAYTLPLKLDDGLSIELPTAYLVDDLKVKENAQVTLTGVFSCGDDFEVFSGPQNNISCQLDGHLLCNDLKIRTRDQWEHSETWWRDRLTEFLDQLAGPTPSEVFFQQWLEGNHGLNPQPKIKLRPRTEPVHVHWADFNQPLFVPHDDDQGLRWEVVDWKDLD